MKQTKIFLSLVIGLQLFILVFFFNKEKETFKIKIIECRTSQEKKKYYIYSLIYSSIVCVGVKGVSVSVLEACGYMRRLSLWAGLVLWLTNHRTYMEVKRQLVEIGSLLSPFGTCDPNSVRQGWESKDLHLPNNLAGPENMF